MADLRMSPYRIFILSMILSDVFGPFLCGDQPVQTLADLHDQSRDGLSWKETHRSGATSVRHRR